MSRLMPCFSREMLIRVLTGILMAGVGFSAGYAWGFYRGLNTGLNIQREENSAWQKKAATDEVRPRLDAARKMLDFNHPPAGLFDGVTVPAPAAPASRK